jgi:hypothetical protein
MGHMMKRDGNRLAVAALIVLLIGAGLPALLFGPFRLGLGGSGRLQATLTYAGVMITAAVTLWHADGVAVPAEAARPPAQLPRLSLRALGVRGDEVAFLVFSVPAGER